MNLDEMTNQRLHPIAADLILTMEKRPFVKMLREWRAGSKIKVEIDLINEIVEAIQSGDFDG